MTHKTYIIIMFLMRNDMKIYHYYYYCGLREIVTPRSFYRRKSNEFHFPTNYFIFIQVFIILIKFNNSNSMIKFHGYLNEFKCHRRQNVIF